MGDERPRTKSERGLASMSPEKQREIARNGGRSILNEGRAFSQSAELASKAG
jgi:hypothetical protein